MAKRKGERARTASSRARSFPRRAPSRLHGHHPGLKRRDGCPRRAGCSIGPTRGTGTRRPVPGVSPAAFSPVPVRARVRVFAFFPKTLSLV